MERKTRARQAADERWAGVDVAEGQLEQLARSVVSAWCARAGLGVAEPRSEDVRFDCVVSAPDLAWLVPVMLKSVARDGMTVAAKNANFPGVIVWVFLGNGDGGYAARQQTSMVVLDPRAAWALPTELGVECTRGAYRWPSLTQPLRERLAEHTATTPAQLRTLLERHGWRK
ncbi:hypothetical protein [Nocardia gipuzkoensis]|uniref:hypothetical protein n=1 Tax=Nocardia gipuzkoensis TaxID=2749991 RepID=UPI00237DC94F|nr:hypothetical protein [Nocardia gipuzkoensis]MDE1672639.1 hypothetical protein [Nocardia gipuzkoensis]